MGQLCRQFLACEFHINIFGFGGLDLEGGQSALKTALYLQFSKVHYLTILGITASRSYIPRVISPESIHQCPSHIHTQTQRGRGTEIFGNTHSDKIPQPFSPHFSLCGWRTAHLKRLLHPRHSERVLWEAVKSYQTPRASNLPSFA